IHRIMIQVIAGFNFVLMDKRNLLDLLGADSIRRWKERLRLAESQFNHNRAVMRGFVPPRDLPMVQLPGRMNDYIEAFSDKMDGALSIRERDRVWRITFHRNSIHR